MESGDIQYMNSQIVIIPLKIPENYRKDFIKLIDSNPNSKIPVVYDPNDLMQPHKYIGLSCGFEFGDGDDPNDYLKFIQTCVYELPKGGYYNTTTPFMTTIDGKLARICGFIIRCTKLNI